uniref:Link domain-containing protein n=1 Tax=viral metagenome TaxID=1070528 RepID=A0A6C0I396_9ZZZZ
MDISIYNIFFTQINLIALICFLALYVAAYFGLGQMLKQQPANLEFQLALSRTFDGMVFLLCIVYIILFFVYVKFLDSETLVNIIVAISNYVNENMSLLFTSSFLVFFYGFLILFRVPISDETKPFSISFVENSAWAVFIFTIFVVFFKYVLRTSLTGMIAELFNFDTTKYVTVTSNAVTSNAVTGNAVTGNAVTDNSNYTWVQHYFGSGVTGNTSSTANVVTGNIFTIGAPTTYTATGNIVTTDAVTTGAYVSKAATSGSPTTTTTTTTVTGNILTTSSASPAVTGNTIIANQVFNVSNNLYTYDDAQAICASYGAKLANYDQIENAYNDGAEWCNYGWSADQMILFPTQKMTWNRLQGNKGHENDCGRPGVNGGHIDNPYLKFGVNCFGQRPPATADDLSRLETKKNSILPKTEKDKQLDSKIQYWKDNAATLLQLSSYNNKKWSEY